MKHPVRIFFILLTCLATGQLPGQSIELISKQADAFFKSQQYFRAAPLYKQLSIWAPHDHRLLLNRAICDYETNNLDSAAAAASKLIALSKPETNYAYFLSGKIYQAKSDFAQAAFYFKKYLNTTESGSAAHTMTIAEIKRCGTALTLLSSVDAVLIESAGSEVNTIWDEISPIPSINIDSRFYFSSNRESAGLYGNFSNDSESQYDMYSSSLYNGEWSEINALNSNLNSKTHEVLIDFSENGRVVYFKKGQRLDQLKFYADSFKVDSNQNTPFSSLDIPFLLSGDELFYFTDSFLILSSQRPGGLGGYDLYYSKRTNNAWQPVVNMGIQINSPYDEVSPSLANDGRTLFFSSNNINSIGGYDIFYAHYDDRKQAWSEPVNFGLQINSGEDDRYFRLSKNKLGALFASNRKTGTGGFDIYFAYFKQSPAPQTERSRPIFFANVPEYKSSMMGNTPSGETKSYISEVVRMPVIFYISDEQLKLPSMLKKMDEVIASLNVYPTLNTIIEVFSDQIESTPSLDVLFCIKRAESLKEYFVQQGVKPSRIIVKGYGSGFPVARDFVDNKPNPAGQSLNRRIEFTFYPAESSRPETILFQKDSVEVNEKMKVEDRDLFLASENQLNYKIMLLSSGNAANFEVNQLQQVFIEKNNNTGKYELMTGAYPSFTLANQARKSWIKSGYEDALVIPYHSNQRIPPAQMSKWSEKYPDLIQFIYRSE